MLGLILPNLPVRHHLLRLPALGMTATAINPLQGLEIKPAQRLGAKALVVAGLGVREAGRILDQTR